MKLTWKPLDLRLRRTFTISRESLDVRHNVLVRLEVNGHIGLGEAEPTPFYGETAETAIAALERFDPAPLEGIERGEAVDRIVDKCAAQLAGHMSLIAALDCALLDIRGKQLGKPAWKLLSAPGRCSVPTSYTIGIAEPSEMARAAEEVQGLYRLFKIKVGGTNDIACLTEIRRVTNLPIRVDANAAWSADEAVERIREMMEFHIELVEQPCASEDIDGLRRVREAVDVPIIADESCHTTKDLDALNGAVDGVNIKLVKTGGLCEAARLARRAREIGLKVMVGCMTSSSLAVTAAAHIAGWADYVDLDGNLLLTNDPFRGATVRAGVVQIPNSPGLGVSK